MSCVPALAAAQDIDEIFRRYEMDINRQFEAVRQKQNNTFDSRREQINAEFSEFLKKGWKDTPVQKEKPRPAEPEPAPIADDTPAEESTPLPAAEPANAPAPQARPEPVEPIRETPPIPFDNEALPFTFLGNGCTVRLPKALRYNMQDASNNSVSQAWKTLSEERFTDMLVDCICLRKSLNLCDWAYYQLSRSLTAACWGDPDSNEAVLMQAYILAQTGYKLRLARSGDKAVLMLAFSEDIYGAPYSEMNGQKFFCFYGNCHGYVQLCDFEFPGERCFSAYLKSLPVTGEAGIPARVFQSKAYPAATAKVSVSKYLLDFYETYPQCRWDIYASASLSREIKTQLYPGLKKALAGKDEVQSAEILLNFVQTAFGYETDEEQFGREKVFFADECFHYPCCDCEDRAILFSILVKDILGLEAILINYPSHIAAAVRFSGDVTGCYFNVDGDKYVICDPTYIGASVGKAMPELKDTNAQILKIR